jgi:hypothetical protein
MLLGKKKVLDVTISSGVEEMIASTFRLSLVFKFWFYLFNVLVQVYKLFSLFNFETNNQ